MHSVVRRAVAVNLVYLALLILSLFLLGTWLSSPWAGLAAALMGGLTPGVLLLLRRPLIDLALASWVALSFVCLLRRRCEVEGSLSHARWSAVLGAVCGLGMMTKWSFCVYVGVPLLLSLGGDLRRRDWKPFLWFLGAFLLVMGPWYLLNGIPSFLRVKKLSNIKEAGDPDVWTWAGWTWYAAKVLSWQLFWPMALPAAAGVYACVRRRAWDVLMWALIPLALFSLIHNKDPRYYLPALPSLALLAALAPAEWSREKARAAWWALWCAAALFLGLAFQSSAHWPEALRWLGSVHLSIRDDAVAEDWKTEEIVNALAARAAAAPDRAPYHVSLVANHADFQMYGFRLAAALLGRTGILFDTPKARLGEFSDAILWKNGDLGLEFTLGYLKEASALLESPPEWLSRLFVKTREWPLPDGSTAVLFERRARPAPAAAPKTAALKTYPLPGFDAEGVRAAFDAATPADAAAGRFRSIRVECRRLSFKGLPLDGAVLDLRDAEISLDRLAQDGDLFFLHLGEIRPTLRLPAAAAKDYLAKKAPWLQEPDLTLRDGLRLKGRVRGLSFDAAAGVRLTPDGRGVEVRLDALRVGGVPLPLFMAGPYASKVHSLEPSGVMPFRVGLRGLSLNNDVLTIDGGKDADVPGR
jgi:hypothetical protein